MNITSRRSATDFASQALSYVLECEFHRSMRTPVRRRIIEDPLDLIRIALPWRRTRQTRNRPTSPLFARRRAFEDGMVTPGLEAARFVASLERGSFRVVCLSMYFDDVSGRSLLVLG